MRVSAWRGQAALWIVLLLVAGLVPGRASASSTGCRVAGPDGSAIRIECAPGFASERDLVLVYGDRQSQAIGDAWQPEMGDEVWLLRPGGLSRTALIIRFARAADGRARAEVFDDVDGDGHVGSIVSGGTVQVTEGEGYPRVRLLAEGGWWVQDGRVNFNLELAIDGPVQGMIDSPVYLHHLMVDGNPDLVVHVQDRNGNGKPELEWRQAYPPLDETDGYNRTSVMVNTRDDEQELDPSPLPWPFVASTVVDLVKPYFRSPPPIQVDWQHGRIRLLGELVASRARPDNYFIYSQQRLGADRLSTANFEAPFAFYRFDPDGTYPDVAIRHVYFGPDDRYAPTGNTGVPMQQVDFSWRQTGALQRDVPVWDYKLSLAGRNEVEHPTTLGPLLVNVLPFDGLLTWIVGQRWDFATFVAREGPSYASSEGLYEWYPLEHSEPNGRRYLVGLSSDDPSGSFQDIRPGHRAEAVFHLDDRPWLYLSAVDRRLHLKRASYGVWRDERGDVIRYRNVSGGPYVNEWTLEREGAIVETLRDVGGALILTANGGCGIKPLPQAVLFEALPPDTQAAWLDLRRRSAEALPPGAPPDLGTMFDGVATEPAIVEGCSVEGFGRSAGRTGFRLTLEPGFRIDGETEAVASLRGLGPGSYAVSVEDGRLVAMPLAEPNLVPGRPEPAVDLVAAPAPAATMDAILAAQGLPGVFPALLAASLVLASGLGMVVATAVLGGEPAHRATGRSRRPAGRVARAGRR